MANKNLKSIKFPGLTDTYVVPQVDNTLTQTGRPADAKATGDAISELGDSVDGEIDALKEDLSTLNTEGTVPTSEQMLSDNVTVDSVPYHFRKTVSDNADREELEIVGGSVAWNQLAPESIRNNTNSQTTDTKTSLALQFRQSNSPYTSMLYQTIASPTLLQTILEPTFSGYVQALHSGTTSNITLFSGAAMSVIEGHKYLWSINLTSVDVQTINGLVYKDNMLFDLTAMFGSTIADHIYALEQATAGAGVALFKSLFPKDYYAYDAGSIQSVSGLSEHRTVGFNAWDEVWENGWINENTGANVADPTRIRAKNYIPVFPNTEYCFSINGSAQSKAVFYFDSDKNLIHYGYTNTLVFTTPSGTSFIRFCMIPQYGTTYNHDICINLSDPAKNGQYEPYDGHSYALDDSLTLRGIPTLVDGNIKFDGDIYLPSGKVARNYEENDLSTMSWTKYNSTENYDRYITNSIDSHLPDNALCIASAKYLRREGSLTYPNMVFVSSGASKLNITTEVGAYESTADLKASLSGIILVSQKKTPTTENADPYVSPQICHYDGTEEFVSTGIVPVGHNTKYPDNMRAKLDGLPWNFASLIAPTETAYKATRNYTTGALLIVNNVLYKATANIANGGTITVGTNVTATTLAEIIAALS